MENSTIKQILLKNLENVEKEDFNIKIIQKLNIDKKKQHQILFDEKSILHWFILMAGFVLYFYLQQESKLDTNAILIGSIITALPIYLLVFNKIYSLKNNIR